MASMDVFKSDAFSMFELTAALDLVPTVPNYLDTLGIFEPASVRTEYFAVEQRENTLALVQTDLRGAPLATRVNEKRELRYFPTVRVAKHDRINASEIAGIRAFGSETELQQVQAEVMDRMIKVRRDIDITHENMRLGAIQGIVTDADASTIRNWFTEFGISQAAEVDFNLDADGAGAIRKLCAATVRSMMRAAKGAWIPGRTQVYGLCGDAFFDDLTGNAETRATYLNQTAAAELRLGNAFSTFNYGGITFVNYQGTDDNSTVAIGTDKCKFFPVGAPGVFKWAMSPGESFPLVNTPGLPFYAMTIPDAEREMYVDVEVYSYPQYICTRPGMLLRAKRT